MISIRNTMPTGNPPDTILLLRAAISQLPGFQLLTASGIRSRSTIAITGSPGYNTTASLTALK